MEETPATQYIFAPSYGVLHIPRMPNLSVCGISVIGCEGQQRRRDDYRLINGKPENRITMVCSECQRIVAGAPERKVDWTLFHSHRLRDIIT
jgi:hypothetical protein